MSASKRFRDIAGKYYCEACAQALKRRAALDRLAPEQAAARQPETMAPAPLAQPQPVAATPRPTPFKPEAPPESPDGEYALSPADETVTRAPCPKCGSSFQPGHPECVVCGFDPASVPLNPEKAREVLGDFDAPPDEDPEEREARRRRRKEQTEADRLRNVKKCKKCGYEMTGLPAEKQGGVRCPECGTNNRFYTRFEHDEMVSQEMERAAFRKPFIFFCIGAGAYGASFLYIAAKAANKASTSAAIAGGTGGPNFAAAAGVLFGALVVFVAATVIALVVYLLLGRFLLGGVDTHFRHTVFYVSSAMSCALATFAVPATVLGGWVLLFPYGLAAFTYAALLGDFTDTDPRDARIISIATWMFIVALTYTTAFI